MPTVPKGSQPTIEAHPTLSSESTLSPSYHLYLNYPTLASQQGGVGNTHTAQLGLSKVKEIRTKNR